MTMDPILSAALEAVQSAASVCRRIQHRLVTEDTLLKKDRSPVTVADFASQAVLCRKLAASVPDIPVLGEEDTLALERPENRSLLDKIGVFLQEWSAGDILDAIRRGNAQPEGTFFTVDPIDGTKGFLRGDQYAVALALVEDRRVVLGVLGCPNLPASASDEAGTLAFARKGQGAFQRSMSGGPALPIRVSSVGPEGPVRFLESVESGHAHHGMQERVRKAITDHQEAVRIDSQVKYAVLARGDAEVYLRLPSPKTPDYREKIWDHAAGSLIVQEAGGIVSDMNGKPLHFGCGRLLADNAGVVATNGGLHSRVIESVRKAARE